MKKLCLLLSAVLLLACLSGCGVAAGQTGNDPYNTPMPDVPGDPVQTRSWTLSIREEERNVCAEDGRLLVQASYARPELVEDGDGEVVTTNEAVAVALNRYFEDWMTQQLQFLDDVAEMAQEHYGLSDGEDERWGTEGYSYTDIVKTDYWRGGLLLCFRMEYSTYSGGAHPNSWREAVSFDLATGRTVTVPDMTDDLEGLKAAVTDKLLLAITQTDTWTEYGADGFFPDYAGTVAEWMDKTLLFGDEGITVVFNAYDIASYAAGEQAFLLPYSFLQPYLNDYAVTLLGLDSSR